VKRLGCPTRNSQTDALPPAASTPTTTAAEQAKDQQQQDRAYECIYNKLNDTDPEVNTELRQQPIANECAN
jgi:hypothetical protein